MVDEVDSFRQLITIKVGSVYHSYAHIIPTVSEGTTVYTNTPIGYIAYHPVLDHLHFSIEDVSEKPIQNPLRPGGPLTDKDTSGLPTVSENEIYFRKDDNGAIGGVDYTDPNLPIVYGKIDIICRAYDPAGVVNKQGQVQDVGVMQLMWKIDEEGDISYILKDGKWDGALDNSKATILFNEGTILGTEFSADTDDDAQKYFYIITNSNNPADGGCAVLDKAGYWNTKLMKDKNWDGEEAKINDINSAEGPEYPDGEHEVWIRAGSDISTDLGNWVKKKVIIDNFKPYLKKIEIYQDEEMKYYDEWLWDEIEKILKRKKEQKERQTDRIKAGEEVYILLEFSEPMKEVMAGFGSPTEALTAVADSDNKIWEGNIFIDESNTGPQYLSVTGKDIAGNLLDGDPPTIAYRDPVDPEQWIDSNPGKYPGTDYLTPGYDYNHKIVIEGRTTVYTKRGWTESGEYVEEYEYPAWGQSFTGSYFYGGGAKDIEGWQEIILIASKDYMWVTKEDEWEFKFGVSGGGYTYQAGEDAVIRDIMIEVNFYDAGGNWLGSNTEEGEPNKIYEYNKGEYLVLEDGSIIPNPEFCPEDGMIIGRKTVEELAIESGVENPEAVRFVSIGIRSQMANFGEGSPEVYTAIDIKGINWGMEISESQEMEITDAPGVIGSGGGEIKGNVSSIGGNITEIKYRVDRSTWQPAIPVDGAFDSPNEAFTIQISTELTDGEHIIKIKSLNEVGEKDAVREKVEKGSGNGWV